MSYLECARTDFDDLYFLHNLKIGLDTSFSWSPETPKRDFLVPFRISLCSKQKWKDILGVFVFVWASEKCMLENKQTWTTETVQFLPLQNLS